MYLVRNHLCDIVIPHWNDLVHYLGCSLDQPRLTPVSCANYLVATVSTIAKIGVFSRYYVNIHYDPHSDIHSGVFINLLEHSSK